MSIDILSVHFDDVIQSWFLNAETTYEYANANIYPRIGEFEAQRKLQNKKFYQRLRKDIVKGCIMPPITVSFIERDEKLFDNIEQKSKETGFFARYVRENIGSVYVLDGMQRLNTLNSASTDAGYNPSRKLLLNVLISRSNDKLLYRMITLNNGQRPMTPRHQIEILTKELFDLSDLNFIKVQTEKERGDAIIRGAFNYVDISNAYLAFLTNNVNNENSKIIEEKMNEILVGRLFDSGITEQSIEFSDVLRELDRLCSDQALKAWLKTNNNMVGFVVGYRKSYDTIAKMSVEDISSFIKNFEEAFDAINASKVNLGRYRRELSADFIGDVGGKIQMDVSEMMEYIASKTAQ